MKDYKRLTEKDSGGYYFDMERIDDLGGADILYERLAELEDKIESGELCDRNEIIIVKGKVIDEPNEWVYGQLLPNNRIFQKEKHTESKNCGVGVFEVIPETIKPIEMCDREEVRKETAREILLRLYKTTQIYYGNKFLLSSKYVIELANEYGVNLEEENE